MMKASLIVLALAATGMTTQATAAGGTIPVTIEAKPTPAELTAIKRTLSKDDADEPPFSVGHADINGDHRADLIFRSDNSAYCGSAGCDTNAILATPTGYAGKSIGLAYSVGKILVLPSVHNGMHDLRYEGGNHTFTWNGKDYS